MQASQAGSYAVVVTNVAGAETSAVAVLTVWVPPAIVTQPQSTTNVVGTTANFSVTASGTAPLSYQWQFNGTNIGGATSSSSDAEQCASRPSGQLRGGGDQRGGG